MPYGAFIPLIFFTASIKRDASDIKKPRQQAGLDVTLKKQEINNRSGVGSQEMRQADKKRDSFGCNASQLSLTGIVFIDFFHTVLLWPCL
ncbi:hypothetical protein, partial [Aeromonas veronii]|uniref:hypothetical protein n=1 Tax=Aeromonas veronii TaxID=654 RepID=UPI003BA2998B